MITTLKKLLFPFILSEKIIREEERCSKCGKRLREYYTYQRMIRTLSGEVKLNVHVRKCPDHKETNRNTIDALINSSGFDPRITMAVGLLRWIMTTRDPEYRYSSNPVESVYPREKYRTCQGGSFSGFTVFTGGT